MSKNKKKYQKGRKNNNVKKNKKIKKTQKAKKQRIQKKRRNQNNGHKKKIKNLKNKKICKYTAETNKSKKNRILFCGYIIIFSALVILNTNFLKVYAEENSEQRNLSINFQQKYLEENAQTVLKAKKAKEEPKQKITFVQVNLDSEEIKSRGSTVVLEKQDVFEIENESIFEEEEKIEETDWKKLEEMKNNPWTPTLDFLPYIQGDFETNVINMAKLIYKESRGASDEEQQMQGLVLVARCFHPFSFSDGNGNIESAIFRTGQYPWAKNGIDNIVPDEQALRNARAVLTGNVLDTENIRGVTRNVEYANTTSLGYETYCKIWNEPCQKWVYFDYGL